jgi:predicted TIM-barrel fold metal-dependent hydrolase
MNCQSKLAELRAKTDRQLVILIRSTLDEGLRSRAEAERAYSEVRVLLPTVRHVTEADRRRLESKLARLRELLDERPVLAIS